MEHKARLCKKHSVSKALFLDHLRSSSKNTHY